MNGNLAKKIFFSLLVLALSWGVFCQETQIDFYGIVSPDADANMTGLTSDLYLTQLSALGNFRVRDKRTAEFAAALIEKGEVNFSGTAVSFYAVITKSNAGGTWICTLHLSTPGSNKEISYSKEFDSYYKIMTDAKQTIASLFDARSGTAGGTSQSQAGAAVARPAAQADSVVLPKVSTDAVAGTWRGEEYIDKIVILRGGRGFIIFKNGASMNISVKISENDNNVTVLQSGPSNASFFPWLPRQTALELATEASPMSWKFSLTENGMLSGSKDTYALNGEAAVQATEKITWTRVN